MERIAPVAEYSSSAPYAPAITVIWDTVGSAASTMNTLRQSPVTPVSMQTSAQTAGAMRSLMTSMVGIPFSNRTFRMPSS